MFTRRFWRDALERAAKTAAQTLAASGLLGVGLLDLDWRVALSITGAAVLASLLSSLGSRRVADSESASLVRTDR